MGLLDKEPVRRVRAALAAAGSASEVIVLDGSAGTAAEAAAVLNVPLGAIVKSLVFLIEGAPVLVLVGGDRRCRADGVAAVLGKKGAVERADARTVKAETGFTIGGVAPVGATAAGLPVVIDDALGRFPAVYAAAGHPRCVFATTLAELVRLTAGIVSATVAEAADDHPPPARVV